MKRARTVKHKLERIWDQGMEKRLEILRKTYRRGDTLIVFGFAVLMLAVLAVLGIFVWG
ncbi:hypothetical protein [Caballeronia sp. DA-9]|uniref:hypothetical protein n=1 Tax=Caballeronia sp. DA-9 TaxID=3436237 RepID=UPI003F67C7B2